MFTIILAVVAAIFIVAFGVTLRLFLLEKGFSKVLFEKNRNLDQRCDHLGQKNKRLKRMLVKTNTMHGNTIARLQSELRGERELTNHHLQQLTVKDRLLQQAYALLELVLEEKDADSLSETAPPSRDRMRALFVA